MGSGMSQLSVFQLGLLQRAIGGLCKLFRKWKKIQDQTKMKRKQANLKGFPVGLFPLHFRLILGYFLLSPVFLDARKPTLQIPIPPEEDPHEN